MKRKSITRRQFLHLSGAGLAGVGADVLLPQLGHSASGKTEDRYSKFTAGEIIDRIKKNVDVPWRDVTVDTFKDGAGPAIVVSGITTTFMATLDVLHKSVKAGHNFILAHEPAFWTNLDLGEGLAGDLCTFISWITSNGTIFLFTAFTITGMPANPTASTKDGTP